MKNQIIKFIFLVSLSFSVQSFANFINKIDFIGLNTIPSSSLIDLLPVEIGDQYNTQISNKIIEVLFKTGYFSDIEIDVDNNIVNSWNKDDGSVVIENASESPSTSVPDKVIVVSLSSSALII